ncbi:MAG TPA: TRAP transporter small permease [Pseudolabrys sp.]|nr:TRAP transporter small permease [Pseudolabrys sp.]
MTLSKVRAAYEHLLETIALILMVALTALIIAGAVFRYVGEALSWYDELASIGLVWLTYYGSALAALRGAHIGVPGLVNAMPPKLRVAVTIFSETVVILFFVLLAIYGFKVLIILQGEHMVSLPSVPTQLTQSAIPVGAIMFIIAELLRLPEVLHQARTTGFVDLEVKEALELGEHEGKSRPAGGLQ